MPNYIEIEPYLVKQATIFWNFVKNQLFWLTLWPRKRIQGHNWLCPCRYCHYASIFQVLSKLYNKWQNVPMFSENMPKISHISSPYDLKSRPKVIIFSVHLGTDTMHPHVKLKWNWTTCDAMCHRFLKNCQKSVILVDPVTLKVSQSSSFFACIYALTQCILMMSMTEIEW